MRQPSGRLSDRTLPPLSTAEKAASARGGTPPPPGRSSHGKPEPPPGRLPIERAPLGRHGRARGDPPLLERRPCGHTYGRKSGPLSFAGFSNHKDPPFARKATGPPGAISTGMATCLPTPWDGRPDQVPWTGRRSRGDPPGNTASRRGSDPPKSRVGLAPSGPVRPIPIGRASFRHGHSRGDPSPCVLRTRNTSAHYMYGSPYALINLSKSAKAMNNLLTGSRWGPSGHNARTVPVGRPNYRALHLFTE